MYYVYYAPMVLAGLGVIALLVAWRRDKSYLLAWALLALGYVGITGMEVRSGRYGWAALDFALLILFACLLTKELRFRWDAKVLLRHSKKWRAQKAQGEAESGGEA